MKVVFFSQQNNFTRSQKQNIVFSAGLNAQFAQEIKNADVAEISSRLIQKGIETDFKDNKILAWGSNKIVDIFQQLNEKFNLKLALPRGIFVEDFGKLNINDPQAAGFCNFAPTALFKNSNEPTPPGAVFFNTFETILNYVPAGEKWLYDWGQIDKIMDKHFVDKFKSTDFFLEPILDEFIHVAHANRMHNKLGGKIMSKRIQSVNDVKQAEEFQKKYGIKLSTICNYATNPFDAVSCNMTGLIVNSLDKTTLEPIKNPFIGTPYENISFFRRILSQNQQSGRGLSLEEILKRFWDGKFD